MPTYIVRFMYDGRLMQESVPSTTPSGARTIIEGRYPGCHIISVSA
jgi:hypothetical protein